MEAPSSSNLSSWTAHRRNQNGRAGFSLVEILMTIAVISTLAVIGVFAGTSLTQATGQTKLTRDVAVLNKALRQYELAGGSLAEVTDAQAVINKLKTRTTGDTWKGVAGLKGSMVDNRLAILNQTAAEALAGEPRANYDTTSKRFEIRTSGAAGIRGFVLDATLANTDFGTESRRTSMDLAKRDKWVWDYQEDSQTSGGARAPSQQTTSTEEAVAQPSDKILLSLSNPVLSVPPGTYPLRNYPLLLSLVDPNPTHAAELQWSTDGGAWQVYETGRVFEPGVQVSAWAESLDPDNYASSNVVTGNYQTTPETPVLSLAFPDTDLSYRELGGPMQPSGTGLVPPAGSLSLANADSFPLFYQNSSVFQPAWTMDGSNPLTSNTGAMSPAFTNGYPGDVIPLSLAGWPAASATLTAKAAVRTQRAELVNPSAVQTVTLTRQVMALPQPVISFGNPDCTLSLDSSANNLPVGARIFFNTNGTDPGDNAGEPVSGTLYTGPFLAESLDNNARVVARTYPPEDWKPWFTTSPAASRDVITPGGTGGYIGGQFTATGVVGGGGVARLLSDGTVDSTFNVGAGISNGSRVQALSRAGSGVLVGGDFTTFAGINRKALVRLQANGAVDSTFAPVIEDTGSNAQFTIDWAQLPLIQNAVLSGEDTASSSPSNPNHGLSTAGGFTGFGSQVFSNVGGSGVDMTLHYSQNMRGDLPGSVTHRGPNLYGPDASHLGGVNPDRRVTGPVALRFTNDRVGTITPATVGLSFSEPVNFDRVLWGSISEISGHKENALFRAYSGPQAGGSVVPATTFVNYSAENGPLFGVASDPVTNNAASNITTATPGTGLYMATGQGSQSDNRYGRIQLSYTGTPVQSMALSNWTTQTTAAAGGTYDPAKPFGQAQDFSIFSYTNIDLLSGGGGTVGGVAAGGNLTYGANGGFWMGGVAGRDALVVNGTLTASGGNGALSNGNAAYGSTPNAAQINVYNGTKRQATNVLPFTAIRDAHRSLSTQWKALPNSTGSTITYGTPGGDGKVPITLNAGNLPGLVVFNMNPAMLTNVANWSISSVNSTATVLINIPNATTPTLQNFAISNSGTASQTIFHFPDATTATFSSVGVPGTVFVPNGTVALGSNGSQITGQIIANRIDLRSFYNGGQNVFNGNDLPGPVSVPTTSPSGGFSSMTLCISGFRRSNFQPGAVWAIAPAADGKIMIGGRFRTINGVARRNIARLNADGTLDTSFDPGTGPDGEVWSIRVQADGNVVVGGQFDRWGGAAGTSRVVVLNANGARQTGFTSPVSNGGTDIVRWVGSDSNNRIYIAGNFSSPGGGFARLTASGAVDSSFSTGSGAGSGTIFSASLRGDGSVLVAGDFTSFNGTSRNRVALLGSNGSVVTGWSSSTGFNGTVMALSQRDGSESLLAGGVFSQHLSKTRPGVSVINLAFPSKAANTWGPTNLSVIGIYAVD